MRSSSGSGSGATADELTLVRGSGYAWDAAPASLDALADVICSSTEEIAERARVALLPALAPTAVIIVAPTAAGLPVRIAAPGESPEELATIDWLAIGCPELPDGTGVRRISLPEEIASWPAAGWAARSDGAGVVMIVVLSHELEIGPEEEQAAQLVTMVAAARERGIGVAPSSATLAFSHAVSQERDRVRWELASSHSAKLSALLKILQAAGTNGVRSAPPGVATAIELASQALLDVKTAMQRQDEELYVPWTDAFDEVEAALRNNLRPRHMRLVVGREGAQDGMLPRAIARAARVVSCTAATDATLHPGADKIRVSWTLTTDALQITVSDNGDGFQPRDPQLTAEHAALAGRVAALGGVVEIDTAPRWGTAATCRLPLHAPSAVPESPASVHIAQLRPREREVLELLAAGLANREIAERLHITVRTVKFHVSSILRRLGARSRAELIVLAHNAGITGQAGC